MAILRNVDDFLLRVFTFNFRYKRFEERPQTTLALLSTLGLLIILLGSFMTEGLTWLGILAVILMGLSTLYEWRLWLRLRSQGIVNPVTEGISVFSPLIHMFYGIREGMKRK